MAKRNRSSRRRDSSTIANAKLPLGYFSPTRSGELVSIQDRRLWSPVFKPAITKRSTVRRLVEATPAPKTRSTPNRFGQGVLSFKVPERVLICVRRSQRKQVIHAKGIAGGKVRKPRRNAFSSISCKKG